MFPKPKKSDRPKRKRIGQKDATKARNRLYRVLVRPAYLAGLAAGQGRKNQRPLCERCGVNHVSDVHHKAGRDGEQVLDPKMLDGLCADCHKHVHANPLESMEEGWLVSRHRRTQPE